ncbi:DUF4422 domain-containing protein [Helicobacter sp. MIT 05-5293]|uniref:DUF4422 domain-containing protein n=1 Tax=Helicobacter sp. MIT 05-5293 TaxID=1548149 RepID=UPI0010FDBF28|nr:DUF4422 domain-containing protein [Helicobacter sp. MIT 05-5293]TLD80475.1 DUF4422 domain-containing protein [Helicobacter sp. MIT 05-5293]
MNIKILVCYHKPSPIIANEVLQPILLGAQGANAKVKDELENLCKRAKTTLWYDNTGEHISELNPYFCELTAMYWAWKNLDADYYGLFHYRRVLDFGAKIPLKNYNDVNHIRIAPSRLIDTFGLNPRIIEQNLQQADIIVSKRIVVPYGWESARFFNQYEIYAKDHHRKDLDIVLEIIRNKYPHYEEALQKVFFTKGQRLSWCNMFVMRKELYFEYCDFLFDVLFEAQKHIDITFYTPRQSRIYGFLAERLFNVFIVHKNLTSRTKIKKFRLWQLKDMRPWFGWIQEDNIKRFYLFGIRVWKTHLGA